MSKNVEMIKTLQEGFDTTDDQGVFLLFKDKEGGVGALLKGNGSVLRNIVASTLLSEHPSRMILCHAMTSVATKDKSVLQDLLRTVFFLEPSLADVAEKELEDFREMQKSEADAGFRALRDIIGMMPEKDQEKIAEHLEKTHQELKESEE